MSTTIDHVALANQRLATQYKESTNLIAYISVLLAEADTLEQVFQSIITDRWLDNAAGVNLDIIGAIVGQPRTVEDITQLVFFGFDGAAGAASFGDVDNPGLGARFLGEGEPTTGKSILADPEYRLFIHARIAKNSTTTTAEDVASLVGFLLNIDTVFVLDVSEATASINVGSLLSDNDKVLITNAGLVPKPAGVSYEYVEFDAGEAFAFSGFPDAKGFADAATPEDGGRFASSF